MSEKPPDFVTTTIITNQIHYTKNTLINMKYLYTK
jgi:hypothetical protein